MNFVAHTSEMNAQRVLSAVPSHDPALQRILEFVRAHFGTAAALISVLDAERQTVLASDGLDLGEVGLAESFCRHTLGEPKALVVRDARLDQRFRNNRLLEFPWRVRFYAGVPLAFDGKNPCGTLCVLDHQPRSFSIGDKAELAMLGDFTIGVAVARVLKLPEPDLAPAFSM